MVKRISASKKPKRVKAENTEHTVVYFLPRYAKTDAAGIKAAAASPLFRQELKRIGKGRKESMQARRKGLYSAIVTPHFFSIAPEKRAAQLSKKGKGQMAGNSLLVTAFSTQFPDTLAGIKQALSTVNKIQLIPVQPETGMKWHFLQTPEDILATKKIMFPMGKKWGCRSMANTFAAIIRKLGAKNVSVAIVPDFYFNRALSGDLHAITKFDFKGKTYLADPLFFKERLVDLGKNKKMREAVNEAKRRGQWIETRSSFSLIKNNEQREKVQERLLNPPK